MEKNKLFFRITLNVTYDVESSEDKKEQSDPHNIAFVESNSGVTNCLNNNFI